MAEVKSFRPAPSVLEAIARNGGGRGLSHRLAQIADRYAEILRRSPPPTLSDAEFNAVRDAINGTLFEPAVAIRGGIALDVESALLDGLAEKWEIDGAGLLKKLSAMTYPQEVRLLEDAELSWATAD